jgi:hypothetical protein
MNHSTSWCYTVWASNSFTRKPRRAYGTTITEWPERQRGNGICLSETYTAWVAWQPKLWLSSGIEWRASRCPRLKRMNIDFFGVSKSLFLDINCYLQKCNTYNFLTHNAPSFRSHGCWTLHLSTFYALSYKLHIPIAKLQSLTRLKDSV